MCKAAQTGPELALRTQMATFDIFAFVNTQQYNFENVSAPKT